MMSITRKDAEYELLKRGLSILGSDENLEDKLFEPFVSTLHNFRIVYEYTEDDWCKYYPGCFDHVETPKDMKVTASECPCCGYPRCGHDHRD
jgi:hypothetical protein